MKRIVACLLTVVTLFSFGVLPATAAETRGEGTYGVDWACYGDLDFSNTVDAKDALEALKASVGKVVLTETQEKLGDVNADTLVNAKDALEILKFTVKKIDGFTVGVFYQINEIQPLPPLDEHYISNYSKNNSENGAYEKDASADTSFSLDISDLPANTLISLSNSVWSEQEGVADDAEIQRLLFSLQGLINRDFGMDENHTTAVYVVGGNDDNGWLAQMQKEGSIFYSSTQNGETAGMQVVKIRKYDDLMATFMETIKKAGIILWDGNVPATANVAATICGLDGYLPVLADSPFHKTLVAAGVPVKQSLVGLFQNGQKGQKISGTSVDSTGSAKNDAYLWALEKYFSRCSTKYIAYTLDGASLIRGYEAYEDNPSASLPDSSLDKACLSNHDYLIARRCFFFDLNPYKADAACDDPAQQNGQAEVGVDNATMLKIFEKRYERANGAFGALMGFVPWWVKYTNHSEQGSQAATWLEWLFCEYITCYNLAKEADAAHPSHMYNGSFMYKYVPKSKTYENNTQAKDITYDPNTYYYAVYVGDYDSSAWLKQHIYDMWIYRGGDKYLGQVPLMWSINPNLYERVPIVFEYMYENKSENDYFVGGDAGAGYLLPEGLIEGRKLSYSGMTRPYPDASAAFTAFSKPYYDRLDMEMTGFVINGAHPTLTKEVAACIAGYSPLLNFTNCYKTPVARYGSTYFVYCQNELNRNAVSSDASGNSTQNYSAMYGYIGTYMKGYKFGAYRTICWTPTQIKLCTDGFKQYAAGKGLNVEYCDPYTYLNMLKAAGNAQVIE